MADTRPPSTKHLGHAYRPLIIFIEDRAFRNERLQHCSFASNCLPVRRPSMTLLPCCGTTRANLIYLVPDLARDATGKLILLRLIFFFFFHKKEERSDLPLNFYLRRIYEKFTNISIISSAYTCKYNERKKKRSLVDLVRSSLACIFSFRPRRLHSNRGLFKRRACVIDRCARAFPIKYQAPC